MLISLERGKWSRCLQTAIELPLASFDDVDSRLTAAAGGCERRRIVVDENGANTQPERHSTCPAIDALGDQVHSIFAGLAAIVLEVDPESGL